jgi:hypothetical protein
MLAVKTDPLDLASVVEDIMDSDLVDGAGQVIVEFLKSAVEGLELTEILDRQDLKKVIGLLTYRFGDELVTPEPWKSIFLRALRLLEVGYYRSLLVEERERAGRANYRFEAMVRFREEMMNGGQ